MAGIGDFHRHIRRLIDKRLSAKTERMTQAMAFVGEEFVREAKRNGTYTDRTGNLRSSIGYIIQKDGLIEKESFEGEKKEGAEAGREFAHQLSPEFSKGHVLIGVAGMKYAAAVEHKNYDVISGSAPNKEEFKAFVEKALL